MEKYTLHWPTKQNSSWVEKIDSVQILSTGEAVEIAPLVKDFTAICLYITTNVLSGQSF